VGGDNLGEENEYRKDEVAMRKNGASGRTGIPRLVQRAWGDER